MKMTKRVLSVLAALALAVSAIPVMTVSAAPNVIATYTFDDMTGLGDTGMGPAPSIASDAERGNVLQLNGGTGSTYQAGAEAAGSQNSTKIDPGTPSSVKLDANPFAGQALTGATISMWVKAPAGAAEKAAGLVGFVSKQYSDLPHPDTIYDKNTTTEKISGQYCYGIGIGAYNEIKNMTNSMVYFGGMLSNTMWVNDESGYFINNPDKWSYVVVTLGNNAADNKVYIDGQLLAQAGPEFGNTIGKRFNHGEAHTSETEANKHEPLLMEVLTAADTTAYMGYTGSMGAAENVLIDDVTYYGSIASDAEVQSMYEAAKAGNTAAGGDATGGGGSDDGSADTGATGGSGSGSNTTSGTKKTASTPNLPQTGVISTGALVACGVAAVAGGTILFRKKKDEK